MPTSLIPVEMHCHTVFSPDAWRTPEELVEIAAQRGVHTLSITDHNHLGAQQRAAARAAQLGLRYVPGIEIDAVTPNGQNCHFVCFNCDMEDTTFQAVANHRSAQYPLQFEEIQPHLKAHGCDLDMDEMTERLSERYPTNPEATVNIWFARELLIEKRQIPDNAAYAQITRAIHQELRASGAAKTWPPTSFETMRDAVHDAGGKVLLAHVARYHRGDMDAQLSLIRELLANGMDGFELYHPDNVGEADFDRLKGLARNTDCLLSCGSDCHDVQDENRNRHFANMKVEDWFLERMV